MTARLTFHGAAGTVTGSCYLLEHGGRRVLIDCGMFQGSKSLRGLNYGPFPFAPGEIDAVLLTHAHIDHSGLVPKLLRAGFDRRILATEGTRDLLSYMLPDSAAVQEADVARLNRRNAKRGFKPVEPIYSRDDAERAISHIDAAGYEHWHAVTRGIRARWWNAAHILGSASIELELDGPGSGQGTGQGSSKTRLLFSGDIGSGDGVLQGVPQGPQLPDLLVMEATYGDRDRPRLDAAQRRAVLRQEVAAAMARGGNLVIPAFAVERTQELLADLAMLFDSRALPQLPVFIDSPLALRATQVFVEHAEELPPGIDAASFRRANFHATETVEDSKAIARVARGAIIVAGSGMCDGGRVRHHLKDNLWRPESTVLLVGYQAGGTLGQVLLSGAPAVRIHGEEIAVKAAIRSIDVYSGHADRAGLLDWASQRLALQAGTSAAQPPHTAALFLTHGEPDGLAGLRQGLIERGVPAERLLVPALDESFEIAAAGAHSLGRPRPRLGAARAAGPDWHNRYADLLMKLAGRLRGSKDDASREALLERLRRDLE